MHIVHLYDGHEQVYDGRGSVPNVVWNIACETATHGHDVTVIERQWTGLPRRATHDGVRFRRIPLRTGADKPWVRVPYQIVSSKVDLSRLVIDRANFALKALGLLRRFDFDVLHVHLPFAANVVVTLAPWIRQCTVFTAHLGELRLNMLSEEASTNTPTTAPEPEAMISDGGAVENPSIPAVVQKFSPDVYLAKRAAKTTVLNPDIEQAFESKGVNTDRLAVVPNGVDIERFQEVGESRRGAVRTVHDLDDGPLVLFVGTIMPRKGVADLVRALPDVIEQTADAPDVILAGDREVDESYVKQVENLIRSRGLESHVAMPGFVVEELLPALYAEADVLAVPSLEEGFGMTAIEAMAAGTPVVGTRVGGLPQLIEPGATGELVDPGDVEGLAESLSRVLTASNRAAMCEQARERAAEFSWETVGRQFVTIYEEVTE